MAKTRATAKAATPLPAPAGHQASEKPVGPRSSKAVRTRQRLIDAAKEIFEENGFLDARISDIAERAGQSHGSFYYYFDSKEAVFREVAAAVDDQLFAPLQDVILAQSKLAPRQRVREAMRRYFESFRREARILSLIEQVANYDATISAMCLARHRRHTEQVAETIVQLQRRKLADAKLDPTIAAAALGALSYRFAEMWLVQGAVVCTLDHAVEQVSRIFVNAIGLKDA
jgi:AcrR family transcriptional regulator